jgi:ubiquitin-conjugating enzyme E2 variant
VESSPALPSHYELTRGQAFFSCAALIGIALLLGWLGWRLVAQVDLWRWWTPVALVAGLAAADLGSGLVHWAADTWGRDDWPIVGPRLLVPFRVHHINPDDFLRGSFIDANGEVAMIAIPVVLALLAIPLDPWWGGPIGVFGFAFCGLGSLTNQIHQWAHMSSPPPVVRLMQRCGVLLDRDTHAAHHARPYDRRYCITTGWCNRPLDAIGFFRRLESLIAWSTGVVPREDDRQYDARYATGRPQTDSAGG